VIEAGGFRLLCDFGETNAGRLGEIAPDAIWISHAHPDHAGGLREGTSLPVYATQTTFEILRDLPVGDWRVLAPGREARIGPLRLTPHEVVHSLRCPCAAARIVAGGRVLVYSGDVVSILDEEAALSGADLYVGDGSTLTRPLVRRHSSGALFGHTTVRAQLGWLARRRVPRAVFSHFGSEAIRMGDRDLASRLRRLAAEKAPGCEVTLAWDGAEIQL
jgi:ribonuclease BN (tRNA processing enzyme)